MNSQTKTKKDSPLAWAQEAERALTKSPRTTLKDINHLIISTSQPANVTLAAALWGLTMDLTKNSWTWSRTNLVLFIHPFNKPHRATQSQWSALRYDNIREGYRGRWKIYAAHSKKLWSETKGVTPAMLKTEDLPIDNAWRSEQCLPEARTYEKNRGASWSKTLREADWQGLKGDS